TDPVVVCDTQDATLRSKVIVWSNIPSLRSKYTDAGGDPFVAARPQRRPPCRRETPAVLKKYFCSLREYFQSARYL
ncbi:hypothetical protein FKM82_028792, partial [Ascaphus truei]